VSKAARFSGSFVLSNEEVKPCVSAFGFAVTAVVVAALIACAKKAADKSSVQPSPPSVQLPLRRRVQSFQRHWLSSPSAPVEWLRKLPASQEFNTEAYDHIEENRFHRVDADPLSTFSIDVDTASYANVRRFLR
jgi:Ca-activated chloride channel family protein